MSNDLTTFAAEGWDCQRANASTIGDPAKACPYLNTSDASNAWHLGREWARLGESRPTPDMKPRTAGRIAVFAGRSNTLSVRGYGDMLICRFRINPDNTLKEIRQ